MTQHVRRLTYPSRIDMLGPTTSSEPSLRNPRPKSVETMARHMAAIGPWCNASSGIRGKHGCLKMIITKLCLQKNTSRGQQTMVLHSPLHDLPIPPRLWCDGVMRGKNNHSRQAALSQLRHQHGINPCMAFANGWTPYKRGSRHN